MSCDSKFWHINDFIEAVSTKNYPSNFLSFLQTDCECTISGKGIASFHVLKPPQLRNENILYNKGARNKFNRDLPIDLIECFFAIYFSVFK